MLPRYKKYKTDVVLISTIIPVFIICILYIIWHCHFDVLLIINILTEFSLRIISRKKNVYA